jgi:hypothetical protein
MVRAKTLTSRGLSLPRTTPVETPLSESGTHLRGNEQVHKIQVQAEIERFLRGHLVSLEDHAIAIRLGIDGYCVAESYGIKEPTSFFRVPLGGILGVFSVSLALA